MAAVLEFKKREEYFSSGAIMVALPEERNERERCAEAIGLTLAYARMTESKMLCTQSDTELCTYWLLLRFISMENRDEFIGLLRSDERTESLYNEYCVALQTEIDSAYPIDEVLPKDVLRCVIWTAAINSHEYLAANDG